jgi:protein O-GlcNAc transferase
LTLWTDTAAKNPRGWLPQNNLGTALEAIGRQERAMEAYRRAIENDPTIPDSYVNLGSALVQRGELAAAEQVLRRGVAVKPDHAIANTLLGGVQELLGRLDDAIVHYQAALRNKPVYAPARVNLAFALLKAGRPDEAVHEFGESLRLEPQMASGFRLRVADGYRQVGDFSTAAALFEFVARAEPDNHTAHLRWALCLGAMGRLPDALPPLERAFELAPDDAETIEALATLYGMSGRAADAAAMRERLRRPAR